MLALFSTLLLLLLLSEMLQYIIICWLQSFAQFLLLPSQHSSPRQSELIVWRTSQHWNIQQHLTEIKTEQDWFWSQFEVGRHLKDWWVLWPLFTPREGKCCIYTLLCHRSTILSAEHVSGGWNCSLKLFFLCPLRIFFTFFTNLRFPPFFSVNSA